MHTSMIPRGSIAALTFTTMLVAGCPADDGDDTAVDTSSASTSSAETSSSGTTTGSSSEDGASTEGSSSDGGSSDGGSSSSDAGESSSDEGSSSDETSAAGIEIAGDWVDAFGGAHAITDTQWVQTFGRDSFAYTIDHFDNDADVAIAQSDDDATWSRYDWTFTDDGALYYCQSGFGLASAEEAENTPAADPETPDVSGCGMFPWSALTPQ